MAPLCVALASALLPRVAAARDIPMDPRGFTEFVARRLSQALPGGEVRIESPLTLSIKAASGQTTQANLENTFAFCRREPPACAAAVDRHTQAAVEALRQQSVVPQHSQLRTVVRPAAYFEQVRRLQAGKSDPVAEPFVDDLWLAVVADFPTAMKFVDAGELPKLGLTKKAALDLGKNNVAARLRPLASVTRELPARGIGTITGDPYESSRLALVESWAPVAQRFGGALIVAVPTADAVLYADAREPTAIDATRTLARSIAAKAQRGLSSSVFRWSPSGWTVVPP